MTRSEIIAKLQAANIQFDVNAETADLEKLIPTETGIKPVATKEWERTTFPAYPIVPNPVAIRSAVLLPAGEHKAVSTGVSFAGRSKKQVAAGKTEFNLLYLVFKVNELGEAQVMVSNEELEKFIKPGTEVTIRCGEPKDGFSQIQEIKAA